MVYDCDKHIRFGIFATRIIYGVSPVPFHSVFLRSNYSPTLRFTAFIGHLGDSMGALFRLQHFLRCGDTEKMAD